MAKISKQPSKKAKKTSRKVKKTTFWQRNQTLLSNISCLLLSILIYFCMVNYNAGYKWLFNSLLDNTYKSYSQVKDLSIEEKWEAKLGFDYKYLKFLKENSPENALILMPPIDKIRKQRDGGPFANNSGNISNGAWASYFVYPRKLVYEDSGSKLLDSTTHVAIVEKWGYKYFPNIPADQQQVYSILQKQ